ncbi:F-box domain-containing protein [Fusarium sp. LHS14.1]|nr:F-box domain-containing protein [Fusarium sp. LHS14.1]
MSFSFDCQICGVDMATARIRTPDEPPSAAWNYQGANYVGFFDEPWDEDSQDQECQDCTTADRTPVDPQTLNQSHSDDEPLEYDSDLESENSNNGLPRSSDDESCRDDNDDDGQGGSYDETSEKYNLSGLFDPPRPERLPHGTWHKRFVHYTGNRRFPEKRVLLNRRSVSKIPPEHIASPTCRSLRGINGHVLSLAQMKNCRNVRLLVPKPSNWTTDVSEQLLEESSLFYLSGESNGSNLGVDGHFQPWRSFYPPRHGLHELRTNWEMISEGCDEYDGLRPLAVHSYCVDMYAKASYHRLGRVDLDGLWYWREIEARPDAYGMGDRFPLRRPEVERARKRWDCPWHHFPGDEWLAANPVEIPGICRVLETCMNCADKGQAQLQNARLLALPTEVIHHILSFLDLPDLDTMARAFRRLYDLSQPIFKACVFRDIHWLWEICEGSEYPTSPDRPATWDPLCPPGLLPPELPIGLESKEAEDRLWAEIIEEDPEMDGAGNAVKALNSMRRDEIFGPYRAKQESSLHEWHTFRTSVEAWIRLAQGRTGSSIDGVDWRRMWWLFNPATTSLPGVHNRARIWNHCEQILDCVALAHKSGEIDNKQHDLLEKLSDPEQLLMTMNIYDVDWF